MPSVRGVGSDQVMILGEAPSRHGDPQRPFSELTRAGRRLWRWFGVDSYEALTSIAHLENVFSEPDHDTQVGWSRWQDIKRVSLQQDLVFPVGRYAQSCYRIPPSPCLVSVWRARAGFWLCALPHPSGLNRDLNGVSDESVRIMVRWVIESYAS